MLTSPLVVIGGYDADKHRARILLEGLRTRGIPLHEINISIWRGIRDKGVLTRREKLSAALRQLFVLPLLALRYLRAPSHQLVLIPYPGAFEALVVAPLAKLRGARVAWDLFISPYDTLVYDRRTHRPWHPLAAGLYLVEWIAVRIVTWPFLDTAAHARRFERLMGIAPGTVGHVPLGTDPSRFPPVARRARTAATPLRVLFYGQYIPLHGMETIVRAARDLENSGVSVTFTFAGTGQEQGRVGELISSLGVRSIRQLGWVPAADLHALIQDSDVGLGIFGESAKALSVVPNKVYEMAAAQLPIITGDTPALANFAAGHPWMMLVPPGDHVALAASLARIVAEGLPLPVTPLPIVGPESVADALLAFVEAPR